MPGPFTITAATSSLNLDAQRHAEASFTISNDSGRFIRGRAMLVALSPAVAAWFTLAGEAEHDYPVAGIQQYTVQVTVPPDVAPGTYSFRLDAVGTGNPDEEFTRGPEVAFAVLPPPPPPPPRKPFPIWIPIVAGVVILLVIIGIVAVVLLMNRGASFAGPWVQNFGTMNITQNGSNVNGTYLNQFTGVNGTLDGSVSGNVLNGTWHEGATQGTVQLTLAAAGNTFSGVWNGVNPWCGAKPGVAFPDGCSFAGDWTTNVGAGPTCEMHLIRTDSAVTGTYCNGTLSGTVSYAGGTTLLNGTWLTGASGTLRFYLLGYDARQFQGNWNGAQPWCGARSGQPQPGLCFRP
jgi:hypothetical protein